MSGDLAELLRPRFSYREVLGSGGFGEVIRATDTDLGREVAIKLLHRQGHEAELSREARKLAAIRHPHIVQVYERIRLDDRPGMVMEYVDGSQLSSAPFSDSQRVLEWLYQASNGLATVHARGIVHGDLKPANVLVDASGIRVVDFGLAKRIDVDVEATTGGVAETGGTPGYQAPELVLGESPSAASDVYSLGIAFIRCINGSLPWDGLTPVAQAHRIAYGSPPSVTTSVSRELADLLEEMVQADPEDRPSMQSVAAKCEELGAVSRIVSNASRRTWIPPIAAMLFIVAVGAAVVARHWVDPLPLTSWASSHERILRFDEKGEIEAARTELTALLEKDPSHAAGNASLALVYCLTYANMGRDLVWLERAELAAEAAVALDPQLALAHTARAWVAEYRGESQGAEASYHEALRLDPGEIHALEGYARFLMARKQYTEAEQVLERALAIHPEERLFLDAKGTLLYWQSRYEEAEIAFRKSIELKPNSVYAYANLNAVLTHLGRTDEGISVLQRGLQLRPHVRLYSNLGVALFNKADYAGAAAAFEQAVSDRWGNPGHYLNWANLGDALSWIPGRKSDSRTAYRRALQLLDRDMASKDESPTELSRSALLSAKVGELAAAERRIDRALDLAADDVHLLFRAVQVYEICGMRERALDYLRKALGLGFSLAIVESEPLLMELRRDRRYHTLLAARD
ncbi:MAG: protein kinase [Pseudomonadota bacterium]